jgi:hypothetical protein
MKRIFVIILFTLIYLSTFILSCSSTTNEIGTGVSNPPTTTTSAASAVAAVFTTSSSSSESVNEFAKIPYSIIQEFVNTARAQSEDQGDDDDDENQGQGERNTDCDDDPGCTCTNLLEGFEDGADDLEFTTYGSAGIYGSDNLSITVDEEDFCTESDGQTENSGLGPDGLGRFATFVSQEDIPMNCSDANDSTVTSTISMKAGSIGIWRNTNEDGDYPGYEPEIYGTFIMASDTDEVTINCTIYLGSDDEDISVSDCTTEAGAEVETESDVSCAFDTEDN